MEETIGESLADLDFPFESQCSVATTDGNCVFVHLDLPEIEDVIPETTRRVLKDGSTKIAKRNKKERAAAYAKLVTGLGVLISRMTFAAAPTLLNVRIATYTQRKKARNEDRNGSATAMFTTWK